MGNGYIYEFMSGLKTKYGNVAFKLVSEWKDICIWQLISCFDDKKPKTFVFIFAKGDKRTNETKILSVNLELTAISV